MKYLTMYSAYNKITNLVELTSSSSEHFMRADDEIIRRG